MRDWADVLEANGATPATVRRLVAQLRACEAAAIAFCRLLERWGKGDAHPATPGARRAAFRHAADRVETALAGLEAPLSTYLIELEPDRAEGSSWYGGPGAGELVEWRPVLERAGVTACPNRTAAVYLELAVLVRALQGLDDARPPRRGAGPLLALGGALRPARHAPRRNGRRPPRARGVSVGHPWFPTSPLRRQFTTRSSLASGQSQLWPPRRGSTERDCGARMHRAADGSSSSARSTSTSSCGRAAARAG